MPIAKELAALGFGIMATYNTAAYLRKAGITNVQTILKVQEGRPNAGARRGGVGGWVRWDASGWMLAGRSGPQAENKRSIQHAANAHDCCCRFRLLRCCRFTGAPRVPLTPPIPTLRPAPAEDLLKNGEIQMMIITTAGDEADVRDGKELR